MKDLKLRIYGSLPYALRVVAASLRGCQLQRRRYGRETDQLVEEVLERERWSVNQWSDWQGERRDRILRHAATKVPYYRELWERQKAESGKQKTQSDEAEGGWEKLQNWPVLNKAVLRSWPEKFVVEDCDRRRIFCEYTSGTTGTPLTLWKSREIARKWYALFEARWRRWYGLSRHDRWAILGGQLVTPVEQKEPPFWVWNSASHQLYLSTFHVAPPNATAYVDAMRKHRVTYLWTYSSAAHALAQFILDQNLQPPELKAVITNAEPLYQHQRETIAKAFQCRVFETYGMGEMACAASECLHGRLHLWPEAGVCEVLRDDADLPAGRGETGRLVCTGLINQVMPLIRYEVGDRGALGLADYQCPCGRTLPVVARLEGRINDMLFTPDGQQVYWLNPVLSGLPVRESQIVQEAFDRVVVRYVPAPEFSDEAVRTIRGRLHQRLGEMEVDFEQVSEIPRGPNGKFRAVVCNLSSAEKERLQFQTTLGRGRAES